MKHIQKFLILFIFFGFSSSFSADTTIDIISETIGSASGGYKAIGSTDFLISDSGSNNIGGGGAFYSNTTGIKTYIYTIKTSGDSFSLKNLYMRHYSSVGGVFLDSISITLKDSSGTTLLTKTAGDDTIINTGADISGDGTESFYISTISQDVLTVSPLSDLTLQSGVSQIEITIKDSENADDFGLSSFVVKVEDFESKDKKVNRVTLKNSDGSTSNIIFESPKKESRDRVKKLTIENQTSSESKAQITVLKSDENIDIVIKSDGSFEAVREFEDNSKVGVDGDSLGNSEIYIEEKKEDILKKHSVKVPLGSFIKIEPESKGAKALGVILVDDGELEKSIEFEVDAKFNERIEFITKVGDRAYTIQTLYEADKSEIELIEKESFNRTTTEAIYTGVKSTFEVSNDFNVTLANGKRVKIESISSWHKFEEIQLFDGNRTIKLLFGLADIDEREMESEMEYQLEPKISSYIEFDKLYSNFNLNLTGSWSLVSNPIEDDINITAEVQNFDKLN